MRTRWTTQQPAARGDIHLVTPTPLICYLNKRLTKRWCSRKRKRISSRINASLSASTHSNIRNLPSTTLPRNVTYEVRHWVLSLRTLSSSESLDFAVFFPERAIHNSKVRVATARTFSEIAPVLADFTLPRRRSAVLIEGRRNRIWKTSMAADDAQDLQLAVLNMLVRTAQTEIEVVVGRGRWLDPLRQEQQMWMINREKRETREALAKLSISGSNDQGGIETPI
ncbi:uncharacterized protein FOMMEDRAFT_152051 [Fomitiporia mediterranea MF3/22]|uniref:uncharacterized protein n=1 Tax=Fomitiporia mediterranea (strain MF3/22) TaxID=694068 RepID=UPI00044085EF|nr:uncharacterized protein FOMMEDRAFT_152051 [Fomitiporia mediterranea MF3/22]EJD06745.1 hypothetical protein FOMMEDRAFT_152051 [Fomitiporia mediterranea MF3/22]